MRMANDAQIDKGTLAWGSVTWGSHVGREEVTIKWLVLTHCGHMATYECGNNDSGNGLVPSDEKGSSPDGT